MGFLEKLFPQRSINGMVAAATYGQLNVVKEFIQAGVDIDGVADGFGNMSFKYGVTALMSAAAAGELEVVKYLINKGANVNLKIGAVSAKDLTIATLNDWETGRISGANSDQKIKNLNEVINYLTEQSI